MECKVCEGTGSRPGSDYIDCNAPGCTAAAEHLQLDQYVDQLTHLSARAVAHRVYTTTVRTERALTMEKLAQMQAALNDSQQLAERARQDAEAVTADRDRYKLALEDMQGRVPQQHAQAALSDKEALALVEKFDLQESASMQVELVNHILASQQPAAAPAIDRAPSALGVHLMREAAFMLQNSMFQFCDTGEKAVDLARRIYAAISVHDAAAPAVQVQGSPSQIVVSTGNDDANCFSVVVAIKQGDQTTIVYSNRHTANGDSVGVADLPAALASQASKGAGVPDGYTINRAEGHGWYIDPPKGGRWVAHEGTPAADLIAAMLATPSPAQAQPVADAGLIKYAIADAENQAFQVFLEPGWEIYLKKPAQQTDK